MSNEPLRVRTGDSSISEAAWPSHDVITALSHYLKLRRRREQLFGAHLFSDPAWDMLLDLYVAQQTGRNVSVSSACLASGVPLTTALRWLRRLEHEGLVARDADQTDARRTHVRLTDRAVSRLHRLAQFAADMMP